MPRIKRQRSPRPLMWVLFTEAGLDILYVKRG